MMKQVLFRKAMKTHKELVYNLAFYMTGNKEDAEDITQESFIRLWANFESVHKAARKAWLAKTTRNLSIDSLRKRNKLISGSHPQDPYDESIAEKLPDLQPTPEQRLISVELREYIAKALGKLSETVRSIVILRDLQGMKYEFIAENLDLPLNTVKVYLHRGRKHLMKSLADYPGEELWKK